MKVILTICLFLMAGILFSQDRLADVAVADKPIDPAEVTDPATLSRLLTASCTTEKEKVKIIFRWIADNISYYRVTPKTAKRRSLRIHEEEEVADTAALKPLTERIAIRVLQDRKAYCEGYARLFKSLCDHAAIRAEIVTGYARADMNRTEEKFRSNHSWNAVYIDSAWYLLDVTWASGYITSSTEEFVKRYDEYYFLTPPEDFIRHHYPDDLRWTLLPDPPPLYEFRHTPFRQRSYGKYDITGYYPARGIIEAKPGDTIHFEIETRNAYRNMSIAPDSLWDSSALLQLPVYAYIKPDAVLPGNRVRYSFLVDSDTVEWLHIMYNNDAVLRYKLNVKREKENK
jgi:hypothetical protein